MSERSQGSSFPNPAEPNRSAIESYRSVARWLVSTSGAVAGALLVGVQLTSLGKLKGWHLHVALVSVAVVFIAIFAVIFAALRILTPVRLSYRELPTGNGFDAHRRTKAREEPGTDVVKLLQEQLAEHDTALDTLRRTRDNTASTRHALNVAKEYAAEWDNWADEESWEGTALYVREIFKRSLGVMLVATIAAAAAATTFAYVSSAPAKSTPNPVTNVRVSFSEAKNRPPSSATNVHVSVNEPKTCVDLYLALDELARAKPNIGSHWPTTSLGKQDHACGFHTEKALAHFLSFLAQR